MKIEDSKNMKKKRVYQVAKEFHLSNEALIDFLKTHNFKVRNHMALLSDKMYGLVCEQFMKKEMEDEREPDYKKKLIEKKEVEEARKEAIRHEIDEVLERSRGSTFETVKIVSEKEEAKDTDKKRKKEEIKHDKEKELKILGKIEDFVKEEVRDKPSEKKISKPVLKKEEKKEQKKKEKIDKKAVEKKEAEPVSEKPKRHLKRRPKVTKKLETSEQIDKTEKDIKSKKKRRKRKKEDDRGLEKVTTDIDVQPKKKRKKKKRKQSVKIDEKEIEASIKETLARMSDTPKRKRRKKDKDIEEVVVVEGKTIQTTEFTSVAELANLMNVESSEVIQACISLGLMVTINQRLDQDTIIMVADEFGYDVTFLTEYGEERLENIDIKEEDDPSLLKPRPPVVTIMGHVDHGKTSLLDYIRESNIIAGESGGITQHIGAYEVSFHDKLISFLDTPGHEAFTAMRARGAQVTDIVVLIVAADDNVMPQTVEAINHAKAAGVPIIVAINKMDKPNANPGDIKKQLSNHNVLVEEWGGKVQCAEISAKTGEGIDRLLEIILLEAEMLELMANPDGTVKGVVVEARMDKGKGVVGTVLVQRGTLQVGDPFVAGQYSGRVRAMFDEREHLVKKAPPSTPVQILGFNGMPQAGDILITTETEQEARDIGLKRQQLKREQSFRQMRRLTLDQISQQIAEGTVKELSIIIKADVDGSVEALSDSLMNLGTEDVTVRIIHKGVGTISESDVLLAEASRAVIIGFHVSPNVQAKELAQKEQIDIRLYKVIYDVVDDIKMALSGLLEPEVSEEVIATLEIREIFKASRVGLIAGCYVQSGKVMRNNYAHLIRDGKTIYDGKIATLKRFQDDVKEVASGYECGITLDNFKDIRVGDIVEVYKIVETARSL